MAFSRKKKRICKKRERVSYRFQISEVIKNKGGGGNVEWFRERGGR